MENLQSLENTTDDLKKQLWNLIKNVIPKLEEKIANINTDGSSTDTSALESKISEIEAQLSLIKNTSIPNLEKQIASKDVDALQTQINVLKTQTSTLLNSSIPTLEGEISSIKNSIVPSLEGQISNLTNTIIPSLETEIIEITNTSIPEIESEIEEITNTTIPELAQKIENSQGSASGSEEWTTVYDKTSTDQAINWGYGNGIVSSKGLIATSIDFTPYKFIRVYYTKGSYSIYRDFNIEEVRDATSYIPYFVVTLFDSGVNILTGQAIGLKYDSATGVRQFYVGRGRSWNLKNNAYNTSTDLASDANCFVSKIQVRN